MRWANERCHVKISEQRSSAHSQRSGNASGSDCAASYKSLWLWGQLTQLAGFPRVVSIAHLSMYLICNSSVLTGLFMPHFVI